MSGVTGFLYRVANDDEFRFVIAGSPCSLLVFLDAAHPFHLPPCLCSAFLALDADASTLRMVVLAPQYLAAPQLAQLTSRSYFGGVIVARSLFVRR